MKEESRRPSRVGVVGGTGMIGRELLGLMAERAFPHAVLRIFASPVSAGETVTVGEREIVVEHYSPGIFAELDLAFLCAGKELSLSCAHAAVAAGCTVIDNSSAFRGDPDVPLVVPEINGPDLAKHGGIISNPNCSTIVNAMAVAPLARLFGLRRMIVATYQAASGAGAAGRQELDEATRATLQGEGEIGVVFREGLAFNVIPRVGEALDDGSTDEELKMRSESRRILGLPALQVTTTCVRVPVARCHGVATTLFLEKPADLKAARQALDASPGLVVTDCPTPRAWSGRDEIAVGRLRRDPETREMLSFFAVGDQVRKGGALNAIQIAEVLQAL